MSDGIDIIYDKYIANEKLKNGTKYEKLTAVVFKHLYENDTVIHDLRLRGEGKKAKHQIDVTIEKNNTKKRILVECKDYNSTIGIKVVRDFYGAVHQIKPDDAFVITTIGYKRGAIDFAEDEDIKLIILREFKNEDRKGKLRKFFINYSIITMSNFNITKWIPFDDNELEKLKKSTRKHEGEINTYYTRKTFFYNKDGSVLSTFYNILNPIINFFQIKVGEKNLGTYEFKKKMYIDSFGTLVCVKGFEYEFEGHETISNQIIDEGEKVALLLLESLDNSNLLNEIIYDEDLSKWAFNEHGKVVRK